MGVTASRRVYCHIRKFHKAARTLEGKRGLISALVELELLPIGGSVWIALADRGLLAHLDRSDRVNFPQ